MRAHWGIENQLHRVLDVTFREDDSRVRSNHAPANLNTCRQFALNLLRREVSRASAYAPRSTITAAPRSSSDSDYHSGALPDILILDI